MTNPYSAPAAPLNEPAASHETYQPSMFQWRGRIGRLRYLAYSSGLGIVLLLPVVALQYLLTTPGSTAFFVVQGIITIASFVIAVVLGVRRLNDLGYKGWQSVGLIIPLVNIIVAIWLIFARGDAGPNRYGPPPAPNSTGVTIAALALPILGIVAVIAGMSLGAYDGYRQSGGSSSSQGF